MRETNATRCFHESFPELRAELNHVFLCVDQSGSMAISVVYSSIFPAAVASIPDFSTKLVCFDIQIVNLTDQLELRCSLEFSSGRKRWPCSCEQEVPPIGNRIVELDCHSLITVTGGICGGGAEGGHVRKTACLTDTQSVRLHPYYWVSGHGTVPTVCRIRQTCDRRLLDFRLARHPSTQREL